LGVPGGGVGFLGEYLDLARRVGPNFIRTKGMGTQRRAKRPKIVDAHRGVRAMYILLANSGKPAPKILRITVLAARADAATDTYVSIT